MSRRTPKGSRKHGGTHWVQLPEWLLKTEAWQSLTGNARALYIELKRRYKGGNNGRIQLSHREAAQLLNMHRNSMGALFHQLEDKGFIYMLEGHHLGPSGIGETARWALDEYNIDGKPALKRFLRWKNKTPAQNLCHPVTRTVPHCSNATLN